MKSERVGIVGLGYVGLPLALALGRAFDDTVGFDVSREKIEMLRSRQDPTYEGLENEIATSSVAFTTDAASLRACDVVIVAVPTPIDENRQPDLTALSKASISVGKNLKRGAVVVYESTVYPGVTEEVCGAILERESGMKRGTEFFLGYSPERINPGDKEHSLADIVKVIAGETEAVTESRNSRVPDIAKELGEFGLEAIIHDPFADGRQVCEEYGVHLREWSELNGVNGIVYAVPYTAFKERSTDEIAGLVMKGGVFVDVKSTLSASELPEHLSYWSL